VSRRKIVVDGEEYAYVVGQDNTRITFPDGRSRAVGHDVMTGLSWEQVDRGKRKRYFSVYPSEVAKYLKETKA
jgi:hypothetical protein